jgi:hypothetical protein
MKKARYYTTRIRKSEMDMGAHLAAVLGKMHKKKFPLTEVIHLAMLSLHGELVEEIARQRRKRRR